MRDNKLNIVSASSLFAMKNKDSESINFTELSLHYQNTKVGNVCRDKSLWTVCYDYEKNY